MTAIFLALLIVQAGVGLPEGSTLPSAPLSWDHGELRELPGLWAFDPPWDTNALADSLNTSGPPDGALFVSRRAGPDSSIVLLGYNYLRGGWWSQMARSVDGGISYQSFTLDTGFFVDVCVAGNGRDTCWNLSLVAVGGGAYHLYTRPSYDGGLTWGDTTRCDHGTCTFPDKPMIDTRGGLIVITFTDFTDANRRITMARSTDHGVTWTTGDPRVSNSSSQGSCPAIGPDSMVYAVWGEPASWVPTSIWFNRSSDSGATWGTPSLIQNLGISSHWAGTRPNHTFPAMAVDDNGKLYVVCQNMMQGTGWDVAVWTSTDDGATWSAPVRVNDDLVIDSDQFCPWITLDCHGRPHVFWYDTRNYYPTDDGDVYYSWSEDGGATWAPNERVNDVTPCFQWAARNMMGDYQQIDSDSHYVYCEWSDHRNGRNSWSYIAAARRPLPDFTGVSEGAGARPGPWQQSRLAIQPFRPNPVVDGATVRFALPRGARTQVRIYGPDGRLVRTLADGEMAAGEHELGWDRRDAGGSTVSAGVYLVRLDAAGGVATAPLTVLR